MDDIVPDKIEFNEYDVDHKWDEVEYDEKLKLWRVSGLQGYTMDAWIKASSREEALEKAEDLYGEQA